MARVLKVILVAVAVFVGLSGAGCYGLYRFFKALEKAPLVPENYTETVRTGGKLEAKYLSMGEHAVASVEFPAWMSFQKFELFYPADIADMEGPLPVIVYVNGTGSHASRYPSLRRHAASWGFLTIATEETHAWYGFSAEMCLRFLESLNELKAPDGNENAFYHKIDLDRIGITGQSQGGFGVVNAITLHRHAGNYKAAVILSCNAQSNAGLLWEADASMIRVPTLILGTTGPLDAALASPDSLRLLYRQIPDNVDKLLALRNDADHGESLYYMDGYVTAWFMRYLQDAPDASEAFTGDAPEIQRNPLYQDIESNLK